MPFFTSNPFDLIHGIAFGLISYHIFFGGPFNILRLSASLSGAIYGFVVVVSYVFPQYIYGGETKLLIFLVHIILLFIFLAKSPKFQ